eukprot:NODE_6962_length_426_cov_2.053050_g5349_i0.p4 GENE.NODE_6962_length_426_cov_2.053050_g5349_i0~~NODE_6962_length_426_cov_2.053050_g5349_i0.p4  ORF type:complete len:53 (-),score=2.33 NODE_6962_length_426_cov_2.053050_g5349_i0:59-217(-)
MPEPKIVVPGPKYQDVPKKRSDFFCKKKGIHFYKLENYIVQVLGEFDHLWGH